MDVSFAVTRERPGFTGGEFPADCPTRVVLNHVTSRWGVLVLMALESGSRRYGELKREIGGISEKMLASTLRTFEKDGFVLRVAQPTIPPRVDYSLTPRGEEVALRLLPLMDWIADNADAILEGQ
ncbi:winged helix-turn-helix transcriptional regulator [Frondihabitans australicus]|uniref:HxlR family transcriptional regulator n=1 Tax=Frondihabitans australicus TaxID=386892 RepID=A0A495IF08_9MICO|nr:helix-turn-helix domain-containing protein [Frondihabitans australicus]RKR74573.1 HxlR family transcriptional regulator [Frondihabitans australicus]